MATASIRLRDGDQGLSRRCAKCGTTEEAEPLGYAADERTGEFYVTHARFESPGWGSIQFNYVWPNREVTPIILRLCPACAADAVNSTGVSVADLVGAAVARTPPAEGAP